MVGWTTEWNKMEGFAFSEETGEAFVAMSTIAKGMEDRAALGNSTDYFDAGTGNHIKLSENKCGCVYKLSNLDDDWFAGDMSAIICGQPVQGEFPCHTEGIANPDNIASIHGHASLLIGEDSKYHENNFLWHYDLITGELKARIASVPSGAEVCAPNFFPDIGGFSYLTLIVQHPSHPSFGTAGLGFSTWKRSCEHGYSDWSTPGHGSKTRCHDHDL